MRLAGVLGGGVGEEIHAVEVEVGGVGGVVVVVWGVGGHFEEGVYGWVF